MIDANTSRLFLAWRKETRRNGNPTYTPRQALDKAKRGNEPMPGNSRFLSHHDVIRVRDKAGNRKTYVIIHEDDTDAGPPWERESEGHGPVSDWTSRDKRPGEIAKRDGLKPHTGRQAGKQFMCGCNLHITRRILRGMTDCWICIGARDGIRNAALRSGVSIA